jgi:hypothetical protein
VLALPAVLARPARDLPVEVVTDAFDDQSHKDPTSNSPVMSRLSKATLLQTRSRDRTSYASIGGSARNVTVLIGEKTLPLQDGKLGRAPGRLRNLVLGGGAAKPVEPPVPANVGGRGAAIRPGGKAIHFEGVTQTL